jgi:hypothetical protein
MVASRRMQVTPSRTRPAIGTGGSDPACAHACRRALLTAALTLRPARSPPTLSSIYLDRTNRLRQMSMCFSPILMATYRTGMISRKTIRGLPVAEFYDVLALSESENASSNLSKASAQSGIWPPPTYVNAEPRSARRKLSACFLRGLHKAPIHRREMPEERCRPPLLPLESSGAWQAHRPVSSRRVRR